MAKTDAVSGLERICVCACVCTGDQAPAVGDRRRCAEAASTAQMDVECLIRGNKLARKTEK